MAESVVHVLNSFKISKIFKILSMQLESDRTVYK